MVDAVRPVSPGGLPGAIAVEQQGGARVLRLAGEIDGAVVGEFQAAHGRVPVPVDLIDAGQVTFIGSSGVVFLLRWSGGAAHAGRRAALRRSSPVLDRILRLTGLSDALPRLPADT